MVREMVNISVVMPVYNMEKYLEASLDSLVGQTMKDIEIICVDDGSTDKTGEILKEYERQDSRIKWIRQENLGAGAARNKGMEAAIGKYIIFLDSDDIYEKNMLEKLYQTAESCDLDVIVCRSDKFDSDTGKFTDNAGSVKHYLLPEQKVFSSLDIKKNFFLIFIWWPWDKLYRKDFIERLKLRFQDLRTTNDLFFVVCSVISADRISYVDDVLVHHRVGTGDSLSVTREKSWDCFYKALLAVKSFLLKAGLYEQFKQDFLNYCLHFSLWHLETLKGASFFFLYNALHSAWYRELGVLQESALYYYDKKLYRMMRYITDNNGFGHCFLLNSRLPGSSALLNILSQYMRVRIYFAGYGIKGTAKKIVAKCFI